ncbi:hypothetical protein EV384_0688 [Micromonospora kangleipakensis]|uniref:Uncharacterized protein n=1 Tax=Micromonospora kangleipakensis TaxID=1077942 RepID=A0A4Q8B4S9_9ACTN|nr:hypothetical protein [Micromonospora kangleipakensis]RZU72328.1 hypothetical protein EV384_0688 [Micromonospora kangleipakensis]
MDEQNWLAERFEEHTRAAADLLPGKEIEVVPWRERSLASAD